ncbi:helix-turn-helix domain-containing protein [Alkalibacillus sp. S2W]|uniref:helix-turn-helix domain-containing protein n=1 Tax=Alkalibacillus sp. S2W TaxID=3386553 RepID=UPI00398CB09D
MKSYEDTFKIEQLKLNGRQTRKQFHSLEKEERFFDLFLQGDPACLELAQEFDDFDDSDLANGDILRSRKNKLIVACAILTRRMINLGINHQEMYLESDSWINLVEEKETEDQLKRLQQALLIHFLGLVQEHLHIHYSETVRRSMLYVRQNLTDDLSLKTIAKAVHVHPNYLSYLFKKETKIGLSEYVSQMRIDEAKIRLRYSPQSIRDIATDLGFSQPSYFTFQFRKTVGMTPTEFRETHLL